MARKKTKYEKKQAAKKSFLSILFSIFMVFMVVTTLGAVAFYIYTLESIDQVSYPKSPLSEESNLRYSYKEDKNLDLLIKCPSLPVLINVSGTERSVSDCGCVFAYGNDMYISVYEVAGTAFSILSEHFIKDLYNGEIYGAVAYEIVGSDVGYFNGYPSEYQYGNCKMMTSEGSTSKNIYLVSLTLNMGFDKKVMVVVSTSNRKQIYDAGILLQSIGYTIMDTSKTNYIEGESDGIGSYIPETVKSDIKIPLINEQNNEGPVQLPTLDNVQVVSEDVSTWYPYYINVDVGYDNSIFVLDYDNENIQVNDALLYSPDASKTYSPEYMGNGSIRFRVSSPQSGEWLMRVSAESDLGTYSASCMDAKTYDPDSISNTLETNELE